MWLYGSTTITNIFTLTVRGSTLDVRIWRLQASDSDPRTVRVLIIPPKVGEFEFCIHSYIFLNLVFTWLNVFTVDLDYINCTRVENHLVSFDVNTQMIWRSTSSSPSIPHWQIQSTLYNNKTETINCAKYSIYCAKYLKETHNKTLFKIQYVACISQLNWCTVCLSI